MPGSPNLKKTNQRWVGFFNRRCVLAGVRVTPDARIKAPSLTRICYSSFCIVSFVSKQQFSASPPQSQHLRNVESKAVASFIVTEKEKTLEERVEHLGVLADDAEARDAREEAAARHEDRIEAATAAARARAGESAPGMHCSCADQPKKRRTRSGRSTPSGKASRTLSSTVALASSLR